MKIYQILILDLKLRFTLYFKPFIAKLTGQNIFKVLFGLREQPPSKLDLRERVSRLTHDSRLTTFGTLVVVVEIFVVVVAVVVVVEIFVVVVVVLSFSI